MLTWTAPLLDPKPAADRPGCRLTAMQETQLAAAAAAGDRDARNRLIRANLGLVVSIAREFRRRGDGLDDLIAEGNLGLILRGRPFQPGPRHSLRHLRQLLDPRGDPQLLGEYRQAGADPRAHGADAPPLAPGRAAPGGPGWGYAVVRSDGR